MLDDRDKLQGTWHVTSFEADGREVPVESFHGAMMIIEGSGFTSVGMGARYQGTMRLGQTKTPKTIDLSFTAGHAAGTRHLGIYKLDGSTWTICLATRGRGRPETFATGPGTGFALETLERHRGARKATRGESQPEHRARRRAKGADVEPPVAQGDAATELEGEWVMVAGIFNGVAMGQNMVKWCRRITRGNVTAVVAGPQVMLKARFTLDHSTKPHGVDYVNLEGANAGKPQAGIFELHGDLLTICMSAPGQPRPRDFSSKSGDGRSSARWRLAKPGD